MNINSIPFNTPLVIFLMGPTACGKSKLAIKLRKLLPVEIISVDSALIYRGMDVGTAKPSSITLLSHPHSLINIKDPSEIYSVSEFYTDVLTKIKSIINLKRIPLLVGGTMFYFNILLKGLSKLPSRNSIIRSNLLNIAKRKGNYFLHNQLKLIDIISANRIHFNDVQRVIRALEVFLISGKTLTQIYKLDFIAFPYTTIQFSINPISKKWLHEKIIQRFNRMLSLGFEEEVKMLMARGDLNIHLPSMKCVGYRQMWNYLKKEISYNDMIYESIQATKKLSKHQLTWLKHWKDINLLDSNNNLDILCDQILSIISKYY